MVEFATEASAYRCAGEFDDEPRGPRQTDDADAVVVARQRARIEVGLMGHWRHHAGCRAQWPIRSRANQQPEVQKKE